jgi:hypothetical protein
LAEKVRTDQRDDAFNRTHDLVNLDITHRANDGEASYLNLRKCFREALVHRKKRRASRDHVIDDGDRPRSREDPLMVDFDALVVSFWGWSLSDTCRG